MTNQEIALEYLRRSSSYDLEGALELASDDLQFQTPTGDVVDKRIMRKIIPAFHARMTSTKMEITGVTAEGGRVAIEAIGSSELKNGKWYNNIYHFLFVIDDGRIKRFHEYCNTEAAKVFSE
jgi:ketosteroid isomerase-like protein